MGKKERIKQAERDRENMIFIITLVRVSGNGIVETRVVGRKPGWFVECVVDL
jgi:hypothetical protein